MDCHWCPGNPTPAKLLYSRLILGSCIIIDMRNIIICCCCRINISGIQTAEFLNENMLVAFSWWNLYVWDHVFCDINLKVTDIKK